jgi:hypothetical protein
MEKLEGTMLRVSNRRLSLPVGSCLIRRLEAGEGKGNWALLAMAKRKNRKNSSIRLKSFNSKGFSHIVKMQLFNV